MFTISMMHFEVVIGWFLNLVLLKGLGGGSLSDNGDIGDLISDLSPLRQKIQKSRPFF